MKLRREEFFLCIKIATAAMLIPELFRLTEGFAIILHDLGLWNDPSLTFHSTISPYYMKFKMIWVLLAVIAYKATWMYHINLSEKRKGVKRRRTWVWISLVGDSVAFLGYYLWNHLSETKAFLPQAPAAEARENS